jgi:phage shock protein PspC (stress-responsive transcriptional regulator)
MVPRPLRSHDRDMTQTPHDTATPGGQGPRVPPAQMRDLNRLRRSTTDRKIAGVAGGIGRHLDVDPTIIRVLLVVLVFFGGAGLLIYGAFWLFVPEDGTDEAPIAARSETRTVVLVAVLVLAALLLLGDSWWWGFGGGWPPPVVPLLVVALVAWLVLRNRDNRASRDRQQPPQDPADLAHGGSVTTTTQQPGDIPPPVPPASAPAYIPPPAPRRPKPRALFGITMAFVLLAQGAVAVIEVAGTALPWAVYPAAALAVIGVALLAGSVLGRSTGLVLSGLVAAAVLASAVWAPNPRFGDIDARPVRAELLQDSYERTAGRIHLDLSDIQDIDRLDGRVLDLGMQAGEVVVETPAGMDVSVESRADGGRLDILGRVVEGRDITNDQATPDTPAPDLHIEVDLGFGNVRVSTP